MPSLATYKNDQPIKMLLIGNSGTGKTGALASLAEAGYKIRILDFDSGVESLAAALSKNPKALANVIYEPCTDALKGLNGRVVPDGMPTAFAKALNLLTNWKIAGEQGYDLGIPATWGKDTILVIDSLTLMSNASMRRIIQLNGGRADTGGKPYQSDWGAAGQEIEGVLQLLYSDSFKCHVIVTSHITMIGGDEKTGAGAKGYPSALGQKLPTKIGRYFNTILLADIKGVGTNAKRIIRSAPEGMVEVKCPYPIERELPLESGLRTFFKTALGTEPTI